MRFHVKSLAAAVMTVLVVGTAVRAEKDEKKEPANDKEFVTMAIACDSHEIKLAELAKKQTKNADVIKFADALIADHTKMRDAFMVRAKAMKVDVTEGTVKEHQDQINHLKTLTNDEFDKTYAKTMVENHEKAVKAVENWSTKTADKDLATMLTEGLPTLKDHKKMAEDLKTKVKQ